jgi:hypothetical protein
MTAPKHSPRIIGQAVGLFMLFIVTLMAGATLTSRVDPFRELEQLREKWDYWEQHKDEYDTVFIGTSRTYRGVKPALFDQLTTAAGVPTRSFNFGIDGMISPEDVYVADYVLRDPPKDLRWVFLEVAKFEGNFENRDPINVRTGHWHDWQRTWLCIRSTLWPRQKKVEWSKWFRPDDDQPWPADTAWTHLRLFVSRSLNLGRGAVVVEELLVPRPAKNEILGPERDGFLPYPPDAGLKGAALAAYEKSLAHRQQVPSKLSPLKPHHQEGVDRVLELAQSTGARPVLFVAPSVGPSRLQPAARTGVPVLDFYDVLAFPELFVPEVRVDMQHLNARGAEIFTRELAEKFSQAAAQPAAPVHSPSPRSK